MNLSINRKYWKDSNVLFQRDEYSYPICNLGKKMKQTEKKYQTIEKLM